MPIDLNGNPVEVGDVVNVAFVVKEAWGDDNFCNLILEPVESMPGSGTRQVESFNSRQVVKTPASTPVPASNVGREETGKVTLDMLNQEVSRVDLSPINGKPVSVSPFRGAANTIDVTATVECAGMTESAVIYGYDVVSRDWHAELTIAAAVDRIMEAWGRLAARAGAAAVEPASTMIQEAPAEEAQAQS